MAAGEQDLSAPFKLTWINIAGIALVSAVYFADIFLKAREKCFWFDELFTVYLCRLPSFSALWTAVLRGADFNPPLFYLLTCGAQRIFGDGLIATRLPATVGVWVFGICLLLFVSRRAGMACGFIAGLFPFFTLAQYYAYDARAHGITLGWCGLALLCWQKTEDGRAKYLWLTGFGLSLLGALLTHVYALYLLAPFVVVELYNLLNREQPNWGIVWATLLASLPVIWLIYLPLFRIYRVNVPTTFEAASHDTVQHFLEDVIGPAIVVLLLSLLITALDGVRQVQRAYATARIPKREIVLGRRFRLHSYAWFDRMQDQPWPVHR
jgi:hypothetical protein